MSGRRRKESREKDLTQRYLTGDFDEDRLASGHQRFSSRSKHAQQEKIERTALLRAAEESAAGDIEALPVGQVIQVYSLFCDVLHDEDGKIYLCVVRKTLTKLAETGIVVGDHVRFRATGSVDEQGRPEAVVEQILPRRTVLMRLKDEQVYPIVANAEQLLIVASVYRPIVRWGLVDRMIVAARSGGLLPIVCLNKIDLAADDPEADVSLREGREVLAHYTSLGIGTLQTSVSQRIGLGKLQDLLRGRVTVLAGHSGVGKSSLIHAIEPALDIRIGEVSHFTAKGKHTTTSARRYPLSFGGSVIDTPGVKVFGLWNVTRETLSEFFPDVEAEHAPTWRIESYERILQSLPR